MAAQLADRILGLQEVLQNAVGANGNGTAIDMVGYDDLTVVVVHATTPTATVTFQGSVDGGTTYFSLGLVSCTDQSTVAATDASSGTAKTTGFRMAASTLIPLTNFRAVVSGWSAGAITVKAYRKARAR